MICAVISSLRNQPLSRDLAIFGEIGLAGEIRPVLNGQERLREAEKQGFKCAIIPSANAPKAAVGDLQIVPVTRLVEVMDALRDQLS